MRLSRRLDGEEVLGRYYDEWVSVSGLKHGSWLSVSMRRSKEETPYDYMDGTCTVYACDTINAVSVSGDLFADMISQVVGAVK